MLTRQHAQPSVRSSRRLAAAACGTLLAALALAPAADARVVRLVVDTRTVVAGGKAFGDAGPYERLTCRVFYAFDPASPRDRQIVDLALAPRNAAGLVEAWGDAVILRPVDPAKASGITLVDVVNRGGPTTFVFSLGARRDAGVDSPDYYGDGFLFQRGVTVVAVGWQFDLPPQGDLIRFYPPPAGTPDAPVTGLARSDLTVDAPTRVMSLGHVVGASRAIGYPVANPDDPANVLTRRADPVGPRDVVPRRAWRFARQEPDGTVVDDPRSIYLADGFTPGYIYEAVYRATGAVVVGTGLAAIRDLASYLRHDPASPVPTRVALAYGVSQTGRLLRHFLYQGFNTDEDGRQVFDGLFPHTAGAGRGSFNHRFAQPSRDAQPYSTFFYPTDVFPFASVETTDPATGRRDRLVRTEAAHMPKVFYVDGGYEYWGRAASLTHTTPDGRRDVGFGPLERRYVIASAQHSSPAAFPPAASARVEGRAWYRGNVMDQRLTLRALFVALSDWVTSGTTPPASVYPTLARRELIRPAEVRLPAIPGLTVARVPAQPYRMDVGARWADGIIDREPPDLGAPYPVLVSKPDRYGNEAAGIRGIELRVPVATYLPWRLRAGQAAGNDRLVSFQGSFLPFTRTEAERRAAGDARPSLERLYGSKDRFLAAVDAQSRTLVRERFLLPADVAQARSKMGETWDWIQQSARQ